jgi:hypothetical protein
MAKHQCEASPTLYPVDWENLVVVMMVLISKENILQMSSTLCKQGRLRAQSMPEWSTWPDGLLD